MGWGSASFINLGITGMGNSLPTSRHLEAVIVASLVTWGDGDGGGGDEDSAASMW